ncbi:MAG: AAA family ATPase [Candidatus Bathyarchaeota archaeon]|nr:AAA family ATPase [Candidatus Bathyarchaeota archaeon]
MSADKLVVGLAGMPGSGKSLVVETAKELGYDIVVMGDVIREETIKRGFELTPQNVGKVMLQLRVEGGNYVVAQKCIPKIEAQPSSKVLIDGLRSLFEADIFKEKFAKFSLIAVHASPETRFNRLTSRRRSDDAAEWQVFHDRDMRELGVGLGNVVAMAQEMVINENSVEQVKAKVKECLLRIEQRWK